MNQKRNSSRK